MTTMTHEMEHWVLFRVKTPSLLVFKVILLIIIHTNCRPHDITQTQSLTPLWHCMLTMLFSRDKLFAFLMHINCNASVLQGIIVVIVSRQCGSFCISHEYLAASSRYNCPGPEAGLCWLCSLGSLRTPASGNQGRSGGQREERAEMWWPGAGARGRHRGLIEYLYWHHMLSH